MNALMKNFIARPVVKSALVATAATLVLSIAGPRPANAQAYLGEAFILDGQVGGLLNIGVEINKVQLPHPNGGPGNSATNGIGLSVGPLVTAGVINSHTQEVGATVNSNATINNLSVLPNFSDINLLDLPDLSIGGLGLVDISVTGVGTNPLATATVVHSEATDSPVSSASGSSTVTNLSVLGGVGVNSNGTLNQTIPINVGVLLSVLGGTISTNATVQIGEIIINEQISPAEAGFPDSVRVNALRVKLYSTAQVNASLLGIPINANTNLVGELANTDLVFSSSTAGVNAAAVAAPEPASVALLLMSAGPLALVRRRLRRNR
jgi:hypothetical protein